MKKKIQILLVMSVLAVAGTIWGDIAFGYRDRGVVNVASGETAAGNVILGDGALAAKDGAGILALGPLDDLAFTGAFLWNAGSIRLQGGRLPPLAVAAGDKYAFTSYLGSSSPTPNGDDRSGLTCAKTTDAGSGIVETTGNGWLRVNAVSNNVKTVKVGIPDATSHLGAVLQLEGRVRGVPAPAEGPLAATFVNPDMEMPCTLNDKTFDRCYIYNEIRVEG